MQASGGSLSERISQCGNRIEQLNNAQFEGVALNVQDVECAMYECEPGTGLIQPVDHHETIPMKESRHLE